MSSHHHFHHHYHYQHVPGAAAAAAPVSSCHCCYSATSSTIPFLSPTQPVLHQIHHPQSLYAAGIVPSHSLQSHCHSSTPQDHHPHQNQHYHRQQQQQQQEEAHLIISSLRRRIAALESSLRDRSSVSYTLRDAAAHTIQTHFRAFLARRSRILRQLKELSLIKSALNNLKSSVSDKTHFDHHSLSRKSIDLLLKLDAFKGSDPMIRDGKRSITRELTRFIEFLDGFSAKKQDLRVLLANNARQIGLANKTRVQLGAPKTKKMTVGFENTVGTSMIPDDGEEELESPIVSSAHGSHQLVLKGNGSLSKRKLNNVGAKVKKSVSFAENGNVYRVYMPHNFRVTSDDCEHDSNGMNDSVDEEREILENICEEVAAVGLLSKEAEEEDIDESQTEDEQQSPKTSNSKRGGLNTQNRNGRMSESRRRQHDLHHQIENDGFLFSAPVPVKMESRDDLINRGKIV